jgi:ADP-ribose pyrophosphatase YjhB (NUDIX family)
MNFCSHCGSSVDFRIPEGDNLPRHVCGDCGAIHYQNPKMVTGCIPEWQGRILLCRRAIEPRYGLWTIPAGFMENGETLEQGAKRETDEEACAKVEITGLYALYSLPHMNQVYVFFRGQLVDGSFAPGLESLETALFDESEIPWREMAFRVVTRTLERYFEDRLRGEYTPFIDTVEPQH